MRGNIIITLTVAISPSDTRSADAVATEVLEALGDCDLTEDPYQTVEFCDAVSVSLEAREAHPYDAPCPCGATINDEPATVAQCGCALERLSDRW